MGCLRERTSEIDLHATSEAPAPRRSVTTVTSRCSARRMLRPVLPNHDSYSV